MMLIILSLLLNLTKVESVEIPVANETHIRSILLTGYDRYSRPNETTKISLDLVLKQIVGIDEKNQIVTTSSYLIADWVDPRLVWPNAGYDDYITLRANQIWLPDLYVINTGDTNGFITVSESNLIYVGLIDGSVNTNFGLVGNHSIIYNTKKC